MEVDSGRIIKNKESISDEMPVAAVIPVDGRFFADKKLRPA